MAHKSKAQPELTKPNKSKLRKKLINCTKHAEAQPTNAHAQNTLTRITAKANAHKVYVSSEVVEDAA